MKTIEQISETYRAKIDDLICEWLEELGYDVTDIDFSQLNEALDDLEALL